MTTLETASLTGHQGLTFVLAGNATFTVSNPSGVRYTFKVQRADPRPGQTEADAPVFAKFLTGPDNYSDYTYLGMVVGTGTSVALRATKKSPENAATAHVPFRVLGWVLQVLAGVKSLPEGYAVHHEGKCGRCGRKLTVPESIESGLGPECASKMGL